MNNTNKIDETDGNHTKAIFSCYRGDESRQTDNRRHTRWPEQTNI